MFPRNATSFQANERLKKSLLPSGIRTQHLSKLNFNACLLTFEYSDSNLSKTCYTKSFQVQLAIESSVLF